MMETETGVSQLYLRMTEVHSGPPEAGRGKDYAPGVQFHFRKRRGQGRKWDECTEAQGREKSIQG